ncbi:putative late blight resistance protein homolog R1B-17 [Coffea arabica]|uniref:Late blight resistance protein homolog R1B-17 n=1 Tax=Coffea arabica TaxID=13443 RepID=A0ABM4X4B4_COFAR
MMASAARAGSTSLDRLNAALKCIKYPSEILSRVRDDCNILKKLWESAHKRSDHAATDEEKKNMHFFCLRIEATAEEMALELIRFREEKMVDDHRVKDEESLNELALDCATKTMRLSAEVEEALDHLYMMWSRGGDGSGSSSFVFDCFYTHLLRYVRSTVSAIETMAANHCGDGDSLYDNIGYIQSYLDSLFSHARKIPGATTDDVLQHTQHRWRARGLPSFDACVGHVLSLALRIANRCREYWLNCEAGRIQVMRRELIEFLVDLRPEIHPSNPKFMDFLLNFLMALCLMALCCTEKFALKDFLRSFCRYLFLYVNGHFREEVISLLNLFCYSTCILDDVDTARSFIPEIQAVLVEMASPIESPRCSELLTKICLLKAELFLVVQIHGMKRNTNTTSLSCGMLPDSVMDDCRRIPERLHKYSEKLPPETRLYRQKLVALIESAFEEEKSLHESSWRKETTASVAKKKRQQIEFLVNLHLEIHPGNPKFMGCILNFLMALCCTEKFVLKDFLRSFRHYLLFYVNGHFREELPSLLKLFCYTTHILDDEDTARSFIPEIQAVLVEITSLFESTGRKGDELDNSSRCSELLTKICLLEAELFLVVQIHSMKSNTNTSSLSSIMLPDYKDIMDNCRQIPRRLGTYSEELSPETRLDRKKLLALIESTFKEEKSLFESSRRKEITESVAKNSLLRLHFKIVIFKGESFLNELLLLKSKNDERLMAHGEDQIKVHLRKLEYITLILSDERVKEKEDILGAIGESFRMLTCFSYYFLNTQDEITNLSFSEQLDNVVHLIKVKLTDIIPKFPKLNFPKTSKLDFFDFLWRNLGELLRYDRASTAPVKHHMEEIQIHLKSLRSFVENVSELDVAKHPNLQDLVDRVTDSAYKMEYTVDSIEVHAQWQDFFWLANLLEELRLLSEEARGIHLTTTGAEVQDSNNVSPVSVDKLSTKNTSAIDEIVVDLSNRDNEILNKLTRGSSKLDIVFIAGMPGLGKTTLARKVYSSLKVMRHFHLRAWCSVSQEYEKRRLLLEILTGIHGLTEEIRQMRDEDLQDKLRKLLLKNKYLVVMDDVWGIGAWNDLKNSFPDDANGSRILFTSRLHRVASEIKPDSPPLSLSLFSHEESWQLLEKKVFKEKCCPSELQGVGKEIAYHCQGLPLAVVAVAGILKTTEKSQNSWKTIADNLSSQIIDNPEARCKEVLNLSYKHLPEYLKSCFLYLGVLNEGRDVLVSKLIRFWIAEGFIPETNKGSEDVAEAFLMDLIDRSLVIISKRRSNGKVRACRLHDLVLDFCKSQTEDENFFQLITRSDNPYASFPNTDYGFEFDFYHHSSPVSFASYRLAISLKRSHFIESKPSGLATRSLVFFASTDSEPKRPYDISFIWHNFKLLRVLDFECFNLGISFPLEIGILVQLRYLAVGGYLKSIPQSIANLRKLKSLIVKGLSGKISLPNSIWRIISLRHLHVSVHVAFDSDDEKLGDSSVLENLVNFSCPSFSCGEDAERIIRRLPNLRKLSCIFYESPDSSTNCNQFPRLKCLTHLESLRIFYYGSPLNNGEFNLPLNLKKLTLSNFRLPWSHISTIGRLPNLEVLKLLSGAFVGKLWKVEEKFQNLKFLSLDSLNIAQWNASCDDFPKLERLILQNCKDLEEIPEDFGNIPTLGMIEVHWCGRSAEESAKRIEEEYGDIKVLIRSSNLSS